jgi:hypothetical protein
VSGGERVLLTCWRLPKIGKNCVSVFDIKRYRLVLRS